MYINSWSVLQILPANWTCLQNLDILQNRSIWCSCCIILHTASLIYHWYLALGRINSPLTDLFSHRKHDFVAILRSQLQSNKQPHKLSPCVSRSDNMKTHSRQLFATAMWSTDYGGKTLFGFSMIWMQGGVFLV